MTMPFGSTQSVNGVPQAPAQIGGSGRSYFSVPDAIAGESATEVPFVSQATTTNGTIKGVGLSAVDDFYLGQFVVLVDAAPGNGIAAIWARIIKYVGATQVMTLDSPIDFGVGFNCMIVNPAVVDMNKDQVGDVTIGKSCILNMGGCKVKGKLDVTAGAFAWIRGGEITNGLQDQRSNVGAIRMDKLTVSARENVVYAFLKPNFVNVGGIEAIDCDFRGAVAARQGIVRWVIEGCRNLGINDGDGNIPYRLVEAYNLAIVFSNVSVTITGDFDGAVFMAHGIGALTSAAPNFLSLDADLRCIVGGDVQGAVQSPRQFSLLHVSSNPAATITASSGQVSITGGSVNDGAATDNTTIALDFALLRGRSYTGAGATLTLSMTNPAIIDLSAFGGLSSLVTIDGTGSSTGPMTLNGATARNVNLGAGNLAAVLLRKALAGTGSITIADGAIFTIGGKNFYGVLFEADTTAGTPAITISAPLTIQDCFFLTTFGFNAAATSVSVGTWTISSQINGQGIGVYANTLAAAVSGGTWVMSGNVFISMYGNPANSLSVAASFGTGGTFTVSGQFFVDGGIHATIRHCHARAAGASVTRSGNSFFRNLEVYDSFAFVFSSTGGGSPSVAVGSGGIFCDGVIFEQADVADCEIVNAIGTATGPAQVAFEFCRWDGAGLKTQTGAGAITWAAGTIPFYVDHCSMLGTFTIVGTPFSLFEVFESTFYGSISFSGSRPATRYAWYKCSFQTTFFDATGQPDILDDYFIIANNGSSKARGQLAKIGTTPSAVDTTASDVVDGIVFEAIGANANPATLIKSGVAQVKVTGTVNIGDYLILDSGGTPTQAIPGTIVPGQGVGKALTADSGGLVYAMIDLK